MKKTKQPVSKFNLAKVSIASLVTIFLVGCVGPNEKNYNNNVNSMKQSLLQSSENKKQVQTEAKKLALPSSVTAQMMPTATSLPGVKEHSQTVRFDVAVNNVSVQEFFAGLAHGADCSLILSPDIKGNVTLKLKQVTLLEVLEAVSDLYGYQYEKTSYGYNIYPKTLETRIFMLDKLTLQRSLQTNTQINSSSGDLTQAGSSSGSGGSTTTPSTVTIQATQKDTFWENINTTISALINSSISSNKKDNSSAMVQVNVDTGMVIVRAYPKEMQLVEQYLAKTQRILGREVIIEAEILDVTLLNQESTGINWAALSAGGATPALTPVQTAGLLSSVYTLSMSGDRNNFNYALQLISTQGKVSVLSKPRVSALNNQSAIIKVGSDNYYVTNVQSQVTTGGTGTASNTTTSTINLQAFFSGISLYVTPQITESGEVNLHVHPSVSKVSEDQLDVLVDGQTSQLPVAQSVVRETDTVVHAKDGQVIILGGLMQTDIGVSSSGLPLSPKYRNSLGALTTTRQNSGIKSELVILLRPIIVENNVWPTELEKTAKTAYSDKSTQEFLGNAHQD